MSLMLHMPMERLTSGSVVHDVHVSVLEVTSDEDAIDVSIRIFVDDLLGVFGLVPGEELPEKYSSADELIKSYLKDHLKIKLDGKKQELTYIESNAVMPAVWIDLRIDQVNISSLSTIEIHNSVLLREFKDQLNMVNVRIGDIKESVGLDKNKSTVSFVF